MTTLTFYGGAGEIGGNKILLEDKGVKLYLDFGQSFNFGEDFFYEYLSPRTANGLEVYFEFNLIQKIPKLYSKKMLEFTNLKYQKPDIDGVLISHSHADHTGHLAFLDESVPVYVGHGTHNIMEIQTKLFKGFANFGEHDYKLFKTGDKLKIKHLVIEPIHVDHSIPGAYGFIIKTSKGNIIYTGDLRQHGPQKEMTLEFLKKAAKSKPYALLIEGTNISPEKWKNNEEDVETKAVQIIKGSKGTVFASFAMTNIDRFLSFYRAAKKTKRIFVINTKLAYIIDNLKDKIGGLPDVLKDKNIQVYYRLSKSRKFEEKDYSPWEREYLPNKITAQEIGKNPARYVMFTSFFQLMELVYLQPKAGDFIYSRSEHFLEAEDSEDEKRVMENWLKHFSLKFHQAHCSGHASREDLIKMVKQINPKKVIPIHTQHPGEFKRFHPNVLMVEKGKKYSI